MGYDVNCSIGNFGDLFYSRIDVDKELEKVDEGDKPKSRTFVDGQEIKDIPEHVDTKGEFNTCNYIERLIYSAPASPIQRGGPPLLPISATPLHF